MRVLRVLIATDGSACAEDAVALVATSLEPGRLEVIEILSVVPPVPMPPMHLAGDPRVTLIETESLHAAQLAVERAAGCLAARGHASIGTVTRGHAARVIVDLATRPPFDLVSVGSRGRTAPRRRPAGSVSTKAARYATTDVLVARSPGPVRRIVLGYDASPEADAALERVTSLPWRETIEVTVCSAYDIPRPASSDVPPGMVAEVRAAFRDVERRAREAAGVMAAEAGRRIAARGFAVSHRVGRGAAHEVLAVAASESEADLLVIGAHGRTEVPRFILGSTAATLMTHPPTSVLVVRASGGRP